jgi:DNA-binding PadR family transcriptional regulator
MMKASVIPLERIATKVLLIRGFKAMIDADLAELYGVPTKVLVQAVKRNLDRFPGDFMFQLTDQEFANLRSQIVTSSPGHGGRRVRPYAFTEHGVAMLSSVLRSRRAIAVNIEIMRTFTRLREAIASSRELADRLDELEVRIEAKLTSHDQAIVGILNAIRELTTPIEQRRKRKIGFVQDD